MSVRPRRLVATAHPRSRGENAVGPFPAACAAGSSPLTRGKRRGSTELLDLARLIPAHAGKTPQVGSDRPFTGAHPRSRGENTGAAWTVTRTGGSSPLTRGKRAPRTGGLSRGRLIPAHAGKTHCCYSRTPRISAHPRSRGENPHVVLERGRCHGSSPLTRGKR